MPPPRIPYAILVQHVAGAASQSARVVSLSEEHGCAPPRTRRTMQDAIESYVRFEQYVHFSHESTLCTSLSSNSKLIMSGAGKGMYA